MNNLLAVTNVLLAAVEAAQQSNINVQKVLDMKAKADAEGRELTHEERQSLIDDFQNAIDEIPVSTHE